MDLVFKIAAGMVIGYFAIQKVNQWLVWRRMNQISSAVIGEFKENAEKIIDAIKQEGRLSDEDVKSLSDQVEKAYSLQISQLFDGAYYSLEAIEDLRSKQEKFIEHIVQQADRKAS